MSNATSVTSVKRAKIRKFPARGTIGHLVLSELSKNPNVKCGTLVKMIKKNHPDSKFNPAHLAWYKHQVKKGLYVFPK